MKDEKNIVNKNWYWREATHPLKNHQLVVIIAPL
jgi:hypothetical protein